MTGHLFIVQSDLTRIACDAWLLPTDHVGHVTQSWLIDQRVRRAVDNTNHLLVAPPEGSGEAARTYLIDDEAGGPAIWATSVGASSGTPISYFVSGVEAFITEAAKGLVSNPRDRSQQLLAIPLVGTGEGGAEWFKGGVVDALVRRLVDLTTQGEVDVALVLNDRRSLVAAQAVRWSMVDEGADLWRDLPPKLMDVAERLSRAGSVGRLVVFFGAGPSVSAGLPGWDRLLGDLAGTAGIDEHSLRQLDVRDQAGLIADAVGEERFNRALEDRLATSRYSLLHALIANLPCREYVTTNFDCLFESAMRAANIKAAVLPYEPSSDMDAWLLKLHGSLGRGDIVLTRRDYLGYGRTRTALMGLVQALLITRHMLFVGYSLRDEDFHQIVHDVRTAIRRPQAQHSPFGTALMVEPSDLLADLWKGDLDVLTVAPDGKEASSSPSARLVEILLDRVVAEALRSNADYLLDESFDDLLTDDERRLGIALRRAAIEADGATGPAALAVRAFLKQLGHRTHDLT